MTAIDEDLYFSQEVSLVKQWPSKQAEETIKALGSTQQTALLASVLVPFLLQFSLKSILDKSWPLLNQLQLLSMLVLVSSSYAPVNVVSIDSGYNDIINMSVIPPEFVDEYMPKAKAWVNDLICPP